jgi:hypothetical protein
MAAVLTPILPAAAFAAVRAGEVESSRGECFARTVAAQRALKQDADVYIGDSVGTGTGSSLGLLLGAATRVQLGAESQLRIDRFIINAGGILRLDRGALLYDHDPKDGPDIVTVRTPCGLLAARGTRFFAGPSNGAFGVFVERGAVLVPGVNTAVQLIGGQGTEIAPPGRRTFDAGDLEGATDCGRNGAVRTLSRDSRLGQRIDHSLLIKVFDGRMDCLVECVDVGECLMGEVMRLQVVPDDLDIIEFGRVFWQPLNGEPVCPGGERRA